MLVTEGNFNKVLDRQNFMQRILKAAILDREFGLLF